MKTFKRIISLTLSAMMVLSMLATVTVFADVDPTVVIAPLYVEDFDNENYGYSINTNTSGGANNWYDLNGTKFFSNKNTGHGTTWDVDVWSAAGGEESGIPVPEHNYSYNVKTMKDASDNGILYIRQGVVTGVDKTKLAAYVEDAVAAGADSYSVKFDVKPENTDGNYYGMLTWSYASGDRSAVILYDGKVGYKMHKSGSDPTIDDCTVVPDVAVNGNDWITVEYAWEKGNSIWKINGEEIVKELKYESAVASVPTREIYFHAGEDHALQLDNFEVKAYKFKPSPNSVWVEETFETYDDNTSQGSDSGVIALNATGLFSLGTGGSTGYDGYSRYASIMKEGDNQYLRMVAGGNSGSDATAFTKFAEYITECGAKSFIIDFDFRLENLPGTELELRYKPGKMENGPYFMFYFKEDNVYAKAGNNIFENYKTLDAKTEVKKWDKISFAYNDGVLRAFYNGELAAERGGFESAQDAAYTWLHFGSSAGNAAVSIDNLTFTCFSDGESTVQTSLSGAEEAGGEVTLTATYEGRLIYNPYVMFAIYDADTKELIDVNCGVEDEFGKKVASATIPVEGNVIVKPFAWTNGLKPLDSFEAINVD